MPRHPVARTTLAALSLLGLGAFAACTPSSTAPSAGVDAAHVGTVAGSVPDPLEAAIDASEDDGHGPGDFPNPVGYAMLLPDNCERDPMANVDRPSRLRPIVLCLPMSGTVHDVEALPDGGQRFRLDAPPEQALWGNQRNHDDLGGAIVVVIEPADRPGCTEGRAPRAPVGDRQFGICTGADVDVTEGEYVGVVGTLVLDTGHGWVAIDPAWSVTHEDPPRNGPGIEPGSLPPGIVHPPIPVASVVLDGPCPTWDAKASTAEGVLVECRPPADDLNSPDLRWRRQVEPVPSGTQADTLVR